MRQKFGRHIKSFIPALTIQGLYAGTPEISVTPISPVWPRAHSSRESVGIVKAAKNFRRLLPILTPHESLLTLGSRYYCIASV